jgi:hypothetical protein
MEDAVQERRRGRLRAVRDLILQQLLTEAGSSGIGHDLVSVDAGGAEVAADWEHLRFQPPGPAHGTDVDGEGNGTVTEPRLYQLIRQPGPVGERTFEITFLDPGVHAYAFTFG